MIPLEEFTTIPEGIDQEIKNDKIPDGGITKKTANDIYKQLINGDVSEEIRRKIILAVYQGSDLFYKNCEQ